MGNVSESNNIIFYKNDCAKSVNKLGSLYDMFNSNIFEMDWMIIYLDKREEFGIIDSLVNIMYSKFIHDSFFYLPQLCTLITYKTHTESIENYILDRCVNQMKFSLKVHWLFCSYLENATNKLAKKYEKLLQRIEETIDNGRRKKLNTLKQVSDQQLRSNSEIFKYSIDKELRLKYFEYCVEYYKNLKEMCEKLKEYPRENNKANNRNEALKLYISLFNNKILSTRKEIDIHYPSENTIAKNFYKGVILPFHDSGSTLDEHNSLIVRIIPDNAFCFSTKARVPVRLCVECIRVDECVAFENLFIKDLNSEYEKINSLQEIYDLLKKRENRSKSPEKRLSLKPSKTLDLEKLNHRRLSVKDQKLLNYEKLLFKKSLNEFLNDIKNETEIIEEENINNKDEDIIEVNPDIINPFGKKWSESFLEIKENSPYQNFKSYSIKNFIAKANDDLRQELMTMQLIKKFHEIFTKADIKLKLHPYEILITSSSSGLIEFLPNTNSIDGIKKKLPPNWNLNTFYRNFFQDSFEEAQKNFAESLAAYSLICYYIQIKDRHNGNMLIDMKGNIIHIDFGFVLGINPGNLNFENAPFKLTNEYIEILDGLYSTIFEYFKSLILRGMIEVKKSVDTFIKITEIMSKG